LRVLANELRQRDTVRSNPVVPNANRLFDALGPAARERLRPHVDLVNLTQGRVLSEPGDAPRYAFFPLDGMISLLASTEEGQALEVAMVGDDGFVGVPIVLNVRSSPYQVMVQVSSAAYRVHADAFAREFQRGEELHAIALTYVHGLMLQFVQSAICHSFHSLTPRLCRWLLVIRRCVHSNTIELTQECIAHMLGGSRPKVSHALVALEEKKLIHQGHGRVHIVDAQGLARSSCECYRGATDRQEPQPLRHVR
jgi:CRP-like cAMP-binding protein